MTARAARPARPPADPPLKTIFLGDRRSLAEHAQASPAAGVVPRLVELHPDADADALLGRLREHQPDVVFVFGPRMVPAGALEHVDALIVGLVTEPIAETSESQAQPLDELRRLGRDFDRLVSFDPLPASIAGDTVLMWRSLPPPVADQLFSDPRETPARGGPLFLGRLTESQDRFLGAAEHLRDLVRVVDQAPGEAIRDAGIGLNLHAECGPGFHNRVGIYAACGLLVVTEPLRPTHGLEPGLDYLEIHDPDELRNLLLDLKRDLKAFRRVRMRGRAKAERFRASRVFPELLGDLRRDMAAFGSQRRPR